MNTFATLKIGDRIFYGHYQENGSFFLDSFTIIDIRSNGEFLFFDLMIKTEITSLYKGFQYTLNVPQNEINKTHTDRYHFFTDDSPGNINIIKIRQLSRHFRNHNSYCRNCYNVKIRKRKSRG